MPLAEVLLALELIGTFAFAVSGALLAAKKGVDIIGSLLLASLAGLGGGVIRDVILNEGVPTAFAAPQYLIPVVVAVTAVYVRAIREDRLRRTLLVFDAVGLSVFCVMGTSIAFAAGLNPVAAALLGLTTAVGGGILRDVVANEIPEIFNPKGVYAVPSDAGLGGDCDGAGAGVLQRLRGGGHGGCGVRVPVRGAAARMDGPFGSARQAAERHRRLILGSAWRCLMLQGFAPQRWWGFRGSLRPGRPCWAVRC